MGGTIDGERGDHVLLAPPFITSEKDLDKIVDLLALSIDQSIASLQ
jgi:adenosylmethionine-8-amino-7-oxononanoate aminotransferase